MDHNKTPTSNPEKTGVSSKSEASSKWSILEKMADKYDAGERGRIDQMKDNLSQDQFGESSRYRYEQIDIPPSTLRKIGRLALDRLGIHFARSETRRRREAMAIAVKEYDKEVEQTYLEQERRQEEIRKGIKKEREESELAKARKEREDTQRELIKAMEEYRTNKTKRFQQQRIQELLERNLNSRLLTIDTLEEEVLCKNPEVEKTTRNYQDTEIPVYNLRGLPFSMLSHDVEYRKVSSGDPHHIGIQTSARVVKDPAVWAQSEDGAIREGGFGTRSGNARGNVISASYINSESNLDNRSRATNNENDLCYGFSNLDANELLFVSCRDGGTPNMVDKDAIFLNNGDEEIIESLESSASKGNYNEFLFKRYSEKGQARNPDYIIAEDGIITEDMLRHAKFFNIPIVNIDRSVYEKKMESRVAKALDSIDDNSSYGDISAVVDLIKSTSKYYGDMKVEKAIGKGDQKQQFADRYYYHGKHQHDDIIAKKLIDLGKLEIEKRIDFIADELIKATKDCLLCNQKGKRYHFASDSIDTIYCCDIVDNHNGRRYCLSGEYKRQKSLRDPNKIEFDFRMKGSMRSVSTTIYDGERRSVDEDNKQDVADSDSSYYDKIYPLAMQYIDEIRENEEVAKGQ